MSDIAISVENLGKMYRIGAHQKRPKNLREALQRTALASFNYLGSRMRDATEAETLWALRDVSFEIKRGEAVAIIGRNGAGKSTLLKILSRITDPTQGRAVIRGRVNSLLEVGTGFHPELTGRENVYLSATINGMRKAEIDRKFDDIVAFSEIDKFIDTPVKRYSSGMYIRLAFGVAAYLEPEILLVDEVLAVGDAAFQKKCLGKMGEVSGQGRTVLFVSHNMVAVQSLCNKGIWLDQGTVRQTGSAAAVTSEYLRAGQATALSQRWENPAVAPGTDLCRIRSMAITLEDGRPPTELGMVTPFRIATEYALANAQIPVELTFHIVNEQGIVVFTAGNGVVLQDQKLGAAAGVYRNICHIPGNLLNSGVYFVKVLLIRDWAKAFYVNESLLSFEIVDSATRAEGWQGKEPGVVQPKLIWEVEHSATG